jgi:hypothetical protein
MKFSKLFILLISFTIVLGSCAPVYIPNTINTPLFKHEGELQLAVYAGTAGFDPQISYALTNHIGLMVNGSFMSDESDSSTNFHKHQLIEGGIGYFKSMSDRTRFEIFAGYGGGTVQAQYSNILWTDYADTKMTRFFIQPALGYSTATIDAGLALRYVIVNAGQEPDFETQSYLEPAFTLKAGYKYLKFVGQLGLSIPTSEELYINHQPAMFSMGVNAYLAKGFYK